MKKKRKVIQSLKDSGILDDFIKHLRHEIKGKAARDLLINQFLANIIHNFNALEKARHFKDPARDYLKNLQSDGKKFAKILPKLKAKLKSHHWYLDDLQFILDAKRRIGGAYIKQQTYIKHKPKDYFKDFLCLNLYTILHYCPIIT